jgi:hypothetical protein
MAMITRRAAEAFDRALNASEDPRELARLNLRDQQLVATVRAVRELSPSGGGFDAGSEFREQLRLRLMAEAEGLAAVRASRAAGDRAGKRESPKVLTLGRGRRILAGTVATVLIGGTAAAVASSTAMPGDVLYPVKRGLEEARLATSTSDLARGDTQLAIARTRLEEAEVLASRDGRPGAYGELDPATAERLAIALREFDTSATRGTELLLQDYADRGDPASLAKVDEFLRETLPRLQRLEPELPTELHPLVEQLLAQLGDIAAQVTQTASACGSQCTNLGIGGAGLVAALEQSGVSLDAAGRAIDTPRLPLPLEPGARSGAGPLLGGDGDGGPAADDSAGGSPGVQLDLPGLSLGGSGTGGDSGGTGSGDRIGAGGGGATFAPLPGMGATADLPDVGAGSGGVDARVPLPGVQLGSATVSLPTVGVSVPLLPGGSTTSTTSSASSSSTTQAEDGSCINLGLKICLD